MVRKGGVFGQEAGASVEMWISRVKGLCNVTCHRLIGRLEHHALRKGDFFLQNAGAGTVLLF